MVRLWAAGESCDRRPPLPFAPQRRIWRGMAEIVHPLFSSIGRGLKGRCPACGDGKVFRRYLKGFPD